MNQEDREHLRHTVRGYVALRHPVAFSAPQVCRMIQRRRMVDFRVEDSDVESALELLESLGQVEGVPDSLGRTEYYRATAAGILAHEREGADPMARRGKIAAIPREIREEANQRLLDGKTGSEILPWLNGLPEVREILAARFDGAEVNDENLSNWREGGYQDWLEEQRDIETTRKLAEFSMRLAEASGSDMSQGAISVAAGRMLTQIEGADPETLGDLVDALVSIRHTEISSRKADLEKVKLSQKDRALALEEKKFQRTTAELFLKWYDQRRAREIAEGKGNTETKVADLVQLMFGGRPEGVGDPGD